MAKRIFRLDLTPQARDFEPIAVEPGLPLLDRSNNHNRIVHKWLGRYAAEAEATGESIDLFVCDDEGARPQDIRCEPVSADDLRRMPDLRKDLADLEKKLRAVKPSAREQKLYTTLVRTFDNIMSEAGPSQREFFFFKYHDGGAWRLVWAWGFQRKHVEAGAPSICTNPDCSLYFLRLFDGSKNCPSCEKAAGGSRRRRQTSGLRSLVALLLVAALAGGAGYYFRDKFLSPAAPPAPQLGYEVTPANWVAQVPGQVEFKVVHRGADGKVEDLTSQVTAVADDPGVVRFDRGTTTARARALGKSAVHFHYRDQVLHATVDVRIASKPTKLTLEPDAPTLGIGTTTQLRLLGEFADGRKIDLTEAAQWEPDASGAVACHRGFLQGMAVGTSTIIARYQAAPGDEYMQVATKVAVKDETYTSLKFTLEPAKITVGKSAKLEIAALTAAGEARSIFGSSLLKIGGLESPRLFEIDGNRLLAVRAGSGKLTADFKGLTAEQAVTVLGTDGNAPLVVSPKALRLVVGGKGELTVDGAATGTVKLTSDKPNIAAVSNDGKYLIGRAVGEAVVTVEHGSRSEKVHVEVLAAKLTELVFVPERVAVQVEGNTPLRLVGRIAAAGDTPKYEEFELIEGITWAQLPNPQFVELDPKTLIARGRRPTESVPQIAVARFGEFEAGTAIDVDRPTGRLELTPTGTVKLPPGLAVQVRAWLTSGNAPRAEIDPSRIAEWKREPTEPTNVRFDAASATVRSTKNDGAPFALSARSEAGVSNRIEFQPVDAGYTLSLATDRTILCPGNTGRFIPSVVEPEFAEYYVEGAEYTSSDEKVLAVDLRTGGFQALAPGKATVTVKNIKSSAKAEVEVFERSRVKLEFRPAELALSVDCRVPVKLVRSAAGREEEVSLVGDASQTKLSFGRPEMIAWNAPYLTGVKAGEASELVAENDGFRAALKVTVQTALGKEFKIEPDAPSLAVGQSVAPRVLLRAPVGDAWQEVDPRKVNWTGHADLEWTPAADGLPPILTVGQNAKGTPAVEAQFAALKTPLVVTIKSSPPTGTPTVVADPPGEFLAVGSSRRFDVVVGDGDARNSAVGVKWPSAYESDAVSWQPPVLTAKLPGRTERLTATFGERLIVVVVRTVAAAPVGESTLPEVHLYVTESKVFGRDTDLPTIDSSALLAVVSANESIVRFDQDTRSLQGVAPGRAVVAVTAGEKSFSLPIVVEPRPASTAKSRVVVEPALQNLAVGQRTELRVFEVDEGGQRIDRTGEARIKVAEPDKVSVSGSCLCCLGAGSAAVDVSLPGVVAPASLKLTIEDDPITELFVEPSSLALLVGDVRPLKIEALAKRGRFLVGEHPNLKLVVGGEQPKAVELRGLDVRGVSIGKAQLTASWNAVTAKPVEIDVTDPAPSGLRLEPEQITVAAGGRSGIAAFVRRGDVERPVSKADGLELIVPDSAVARVESDGAAVGGVAVGKTTLQARFEGLAAEAGVTVGPATAKGPLDSALGLQFLPGSRRAPLGAPVAGVRLVRVYADGRQVEVDQRVKFTVDKPKIADVRWTPSGPVFEPKKEGVAQITATFEGLTTQDPLRLEIGPLGKPGLKIVPSPIRVIVGQTTQLTSAKLIYPGGAPPVDVDYELVSKDTKLVTIEGRTIKGVAVGTAHVEVTVKDHPTARDYLTVIVVDPNAPRQVVGRGPVTGAAGPRVGVGRGDVYGGRGGYGHGGYGGYGYPGYGGYGYPGYGYPGYGGYGSVYVPGRGWVPFGYPTGVGVGVPGQVEPLPHGTYPVPYGTGAVPVGTGVPIAVGTGQPYPVGTGPYTPATGQPIGVGTGEPTAIGTGPVAVGTRPLPVGTAMVGPTVNPSGGGVNGAQLILSGPSRTNVGATVEYRIERIDQNGAVDVSGTGAEIVIDEDQRTTARAEPGGKLTALRSGQINVQARYRDLLSNRLPLLIGEVGVADEIRLEIDSRPMEVGEQRSYRVISTPIGGGPTQDLTGLIQVDGTGTATSSVVVSMTVVEPAGGTNVAEHEPPNVTARGPGIVHLVASYGTIKSRPIELSIGVAGPKTNATLKLDRRQLTIGSDQTLPQVRASVVDASGSERQIEAKWTSENESVLKPDGKSWFVGVAPGGKTRLKATYENLTAFVDVDVAPDPFSSVVLNPNPVSDAGGVLRVEVKVEGSGVPDRPLWYRFVTEANPEVGEWRQATSDGARRSVQLTSPDLPQGAGQSYRLEVHASEDKQTVIARHPLNFKLLVTRKVGQE